MSPVKAIHQSLGYAQRAARRERIVGLVLWSALFLVVLGLGSG